MSTMVEKVEIAIAEAHLSEPYDPYFDFYALKEEIADQYYAMARAAIEAMMKPTDDMIEAGDGEDWVTENGNLVSSADAKAHYIAMISAALKEKA